MFWEINILVSTIKELQSFRRSKDRDKNCILCKELNYSLEICCCIMSELEIHVSTPLRGINSVEVSVCSIGSSGDQSCRKLIVDVCNGPGAPSARVVRPGNMQMDQTSMKMKLASKDESGVDEVLEEELDAFTENMPSDISTSRPETPIMTGTSPPIPIPRLSPIGSGSFIGTPTRSSSFNYMYRFSSPEETSPLSSGYGSAPRFFQSTSTQTPPLSPVLLETSISLRLFDSSSDQDPTLSPQELLRIRRQRYCEESRRTRFFSEGSAVPESVPPNEPAGDNAAEPLPDVVAFRRSRANSAPARPVAPEIATGRELRRIGDEFVALFEGQRSLRRNDPHRRSFIRRLFESWKSPISESAPARTSVIRDGSSV